MNHHLSAALAQARAVDLNRRDSEKAMRGSPTDRPPARPRRASTEPRHYTVPVVREIPRPVGPDTLSTSPW